MGQPILANDNGFDDGSPYCSRMAGQFSPPTALCVTKLPAISDRPRPSLDRLCRSSRCWPGGKQEEIVSVNACYGPARRSPEAALETGSGSIVSGVLVGMAVQPAPCVSPLSAGLGAMVLLKR